MKSLTSEVGLLPSNVSMPSPADRAPTPGTTEGNWENEGGRPRAEPLPNSLEAALVRPRLTTVEPRLEDSAALV